MAHIFRFPHNRNSRHCVQHSLVRDKESLKKCAMSEHVFDDEM